MREALDEEPYDTLPTVFTASWVTELGKRLVKTTWKGQHALKQFLSPRLVVQILAQAVVLAKGEPTLVEVLVLFSFPSLSTSFALQSQYSAQVN